MKLIRAAAVVLLLSPAVRAQQPAAIQETRTLHGVVVTTSDVPLARVRVAVTGAQASEPSVFTDQRGEFSVGLPKTAVVHLTFTKARYSDTTVDLRSSDTNRPGDNLRVTLSLGASISGQVRDQFGDPVQMTVTARLVDSALPRAVSAPAFPRSVLTAVTNDLGEFRFFGLRAGQYVIAGPRAAQPVTGEVNPPASDYEQTVNVGVGAEIGGIALTVNMPSQLARYPSTYRVQAEANSTASLRGRVLDARGAPIAHALVQALGPRGLTQGVESDARGRYVLDRLEPGEYRVEAVKRGLMALTPGQNQSPIDYVLMNRSSDRRRVVSLRADQAVDAVDLVLTRGASVSGTIVDEFGEPMQGVSVAPLELRAINGQIRALQVVSALSSATTDDRGRYRLQGLQPGAYVIRARAGGILSAANEYVPFFYPGTPVIDFATPTKLDADESASNVDFVFAPQPTRQVRGTVVYPGAPPPTGSTISLATLSRAGAIQTEPVRTNTRPDGSFAFENVLAGNYLLQASALAPPGPDAIGSVVRQFAEAALTVSGDDPPPVQLRLSPGATLKGRVVYEAITQHPPPSSGVELVAVPAALERDTTLRIAGADFVLLPDDTFEYQGLFGRNFLAAKLSNSNWYLRSIAYKGQELADAAFDFGYTETFRDIDIVVSGAGARVVGRATDARGAAVRDFSVAIFPTDRSMWTLGSRWLKSRPSDQDGTFRVTGLAPGDYWIVAVDRLDGSDVAGELQNPDVLDALASHAQRLTLGEGQTQSLTLRLVRR